MAKRDFEDHCWKDVIDKEVIEIYASYKREVYVGRNPAVLAIDLYRKAYQGGNRPVAEVNKEFDGSCGDVGDSTRQGQPHQLLEERRTCPLGLGRIGPACRALRSNRFL